MIRTARLAAICLAALAFGTQALAASNDAVAKPVKIIIGSVRQGKDDLAVKQFADEAQGKELCGEYWGKASDAQKKEFTQLFHTLFAQQGFPKFRENFKYLDQVLYAPAQVKGNDATLDSTLLINHPLKKQEIKLQYAMLKVGGDWKVLDAKVLGAGGGSLLAVAKEQTMPLLQDGGMEGLLKEMRSMAKEGAKK